MRYIIWKPARVFYITNFSRNYNKIYVLCLSIGLPFFVLLFLYSKYKFFLGLDDIGLRDILSGLYTGAPSPYNFFMLYPLAKILSLLYTWWPGIYWYLVFLTLANYGCLTLILYRIVNSLKRRRFVWAIIIVSIFLTVWMWNLISLEWTVTSAILSATAIFWYATISPDENKRYKAFDYFIPVLLLGISFNLRNLVTEMAIPFIGAIFLHRISKGLRRKDKFFMRETLFCLTFVIIMIVSFMMNYYAYSSDVWREEIKYNGYRAMISDRYGYLDFDEWQALFEKNGITKEMWDVIAYDGNYMLAASGVISSENLKEIANITKEQFYNGISGKDWMIECIKKRVKAIGNSFRLYSFIFYIEMFASVVCGIMRKSKIHVFLSISLLIGFETIWIWLYYGNRLPERVGIALYIIAIATGIGFLWKEPCLSKILHSKCLCTIMALTILIVSGKSISSVNQKYTQYNYEDVLVLKQYCEKHRGNIYLKDYISLLGVELQNGDEKIAANFVPSVPWEGMKPIKNQFIPAGCGQELCSWISYQDNIYLIVQKERAEGVCDRQELLFASRGYKWEWVFEEEINSPKNTFYVYHGVCNE